MGLEPDSARSLARPSDPAPSSFSKLNRVDDGFWTKIERLTRNELDRTLRPWIDESQITAILERRDKMRVEIKSLRSRCDAGMERRPGR